MVGAIVVVVGALVEEGIIVVTVMLVDIMLEKVGVRQLVVLQHPLEQLTVVMLSQEASQTVVQPTTYLMSSLAIN